MQNLFLPQFETWTEYATVDATACTDDAVCDACRFRSSWAASISSRRCPNLKPRMSRASSFGRVKRRTTKAIANDFFRLPTDLTTPNPGCEFLVTKRGCRGWHETCLVFYKAQPKQTHLPRLDHRWAVGHPTYKWCFHSTRWGPEPIVTAISDHEIKVQTFFLLSMESQKV